MLYYKYKKRKEVIYMQRTKKIQNIDRKEKYINNNVDCSIVLTEEDIEALEESERQIARGEVYELKDGMTLLDLINEWREKNK